MHERELSLLLELLHQPTAPFREQRIVEFVTATLRNHDVPFFRDPVGNVIVGCDSRNTYSRLVRARTSEPLRLFVAHMDHPGFHGVRWLSRNRLRVQWHGGGPTRFVNGARVWLADADDHRYDGHMHAVRLTRSRRTIDTAEVRIAASTSLRRYPPETLHGGLRFRAPVWRSGRRLYTQVADDLVGVFAVLTTALGARRGKKRAPFLGLLTRAEEVGFVGAIGHFGLGWLARARRPVLCISLETSRTLPNAAIGKGPVVRLGDRRTVFDPDALNVLAQLARRLLPQRHQRRIMDGGACEATAATVYGLAAVGISVPLGNYHNQGFEGGPDCRRRNGPAPEFVHLDDVDGLLTLCRGLLRSGLPWREPWRVEKSRAEKLLRSYRKLLLG
jgi:putative aminopeptidase FrvX